tara:strand:+ start:64136 stop:64987 length:852 start_codon:yes stop_codon:yes gene_type:complete
MMKNKFIDVLGSKLHYIEEGEGDPIVFIHGVPTSSYMWRNVVSGLSNQGRCIAVDLIGFGQSDKPSIDYTIFDLINYFDAFMEAMKLSNVTLVMHAWGSVVGLDWAMRHSDKLKGIVLLEAHLRPAEQPDMVALPVQERSGVLHDKDGGKHAILEENIYIEKILPNGVMRQLSDVEMDEYRKPFHSAESRKPIWQYLQDLPMGEPTKVVELIAKYSDALQSSEIPKLLLYAMPGFNTSIETVMWARDNLPELEIVEIDDALHYAPESHPKEVAAAIENWCLTL